MYSNKYILEYGNISGDYFKLLIAVRGNWTNALIPLSGYCVLQSKQIKNVFDPIRGFALNINLDASVENPLNDFSDFDDFYFQVAFYRNDAIIFQGYIIADGIVQDYVRDAWTLGMTAVDGLGFLKNYEFSPIVKDRLLPPQEFNYLFAILSRLNLPLPLATYDDINNTFTADGVPFNQELTDPNRRIINKEVFINKNDRFLDCETVLKDILQKYNFAITQANVNGILVWLIYRVPLVTNATNQKGIIWGITNYGVDNQPNWKRDGVFDRPIEIIASDFDKSEVNYTAIHCNENQQITYLPALQNVRFEQKWLGFLDKAPTVFDDTTFTLESGLASMVSGVIRVIQDDDALIAVTQTVATPMETANLCNVLLNLKLKFTVTDTSDVGGRMWTYLRVTADNGDAILYLNRDSNGEAFWSFSPSRIKLPEITTKQEGVFEQNVSIETPPIQNVEIKIILYTGDFFVPDFIPLDFDFYYEFLGYEMFFSDPLLGIGEYHDCKRVNFRSSYLDEPVKVINSNEQNNLFTNNLYRRVMDALEPQNAWTNGNAGEFYSDLLALTSRERIDMRGKPQRVFSGDVYGYVNYFSLVNYYRIEGRFLPLSYSYNTLTNVTALECQEVFSRNIDKVYEKSYIFEDERNVLIKDT